MANGNVGKKHAKVHTLLLEHAYATKSPISTMLFIFSTAIFLLQGYGRI
jgi:hypothetical protein